MTLLTEPALPTTRWMVIIGEIAEKLDGELLSKVEFTPKGLKWPTKPTFDEWLSVGQGLAGLSRSLHWWIGDWLRLGDVEWGEKASQALDQTGFSMDTLARDKWVSERFPNIADRADDLSFSHHREIAHLADPSDRETWLLACKLRSLTVAELRDALKAAGLVGPHSGSLRIGETYADPVITATPGTSRAIGLANAVRCRQCGIHTFRAIESQPMKGKSVIFCPQCVVRMHGALVIQGWT